MKIIAKAKSKGINLNPRTKPKKETKYNETSESKYKFSISDTVIYNGFSEVNRKYIGSECTIIKRNRRKNTDYYAVLFEDGTELKDIASGFLQTQEERENGLLDKDDKNKNHQEEMSDVEKAIILAGLSPHRNRNSCLNPVYGDEEKCDKCCYEKRCVYINKYNYPKMKF